VPVEQTVGERDARGATVSGSQVHSIRLPGFVISAEVIFGMPDQKLTIRHDSGSSARPYVDGALLAIRKVSTLVGVHRGLDTVLDLREVERTRSALCTPAGSAPGTPRGDQEAVVTPRRLPLREL
jgi:hypothetical protein